MCYKEGERLEATVIEMDKGEIVTAYCLQSKYIQEKEWKGVKMPHKTSGNTLPQLLKLPDVIPYAPHLLSLRFAALSLLLSR